MRRRRPSDVLERARTLHEARDYPALVALLSPLDAAGRLDEPELRFLLADAWDVVGEGDRALEQVERLAPVCARRGNDDLHRKRLNLEGILRFERGDIAGAESAWRKMLDAASRAGDEDFVARANNNLGIICTLQGRQAEALACYERALAAYRRLGYLRGLAQAHQNVAITYRELGFGHEADAHFRHAITYARAAGSEDELARAEQERALYFLYMRRDARLADTTARRALHRFRALTEPGGEGEVQRVLGIIALAEDRRTAAREHLDAAVTFARSSHRRLLLAEALEALAALDLVEGDEAAAHARREEAAGIFEALGAAAWGERIRLRMTAVAASVATVR